MCVCGVVFVVGGGGGEGGGSSRCVCEVDMSGISEYEI